MLLSLSIALIISFSIAWLVYLADKKRVVPKPIVTATLRGLLVFLVLFLLLSPKFDKTISETQKPIVLLLQDNSQSMKAALGKDSIDYKNKLKSLTEKIDARYQLLIWNLNGTSNIDSLGVFSNPKTNLSKAIDDAAELYGQQNLAAIILSSDGWYNEGNNPIYSETPINSSFYSIALGDTALQQDARIDKVYANKSVALNSQFEIRADFIAKACGGNKTTASISDEKGSVLATMPVNIGSSQYDGSLIFSLKATKVGLQRYQISIPKIGDEKNTDNNIATTFVQIVAEKKKVLIVAAAPHPDIKAITESLKGLQQYEVTTAIGNEIPNNISEFDCIVLHQLPSAISSISPSTLAGKNVWYIAGAQSNYAQLNASQNLINFSQSINKHNAEPLLNKTFNTFSLPATIGSLPEILPPLSIASADTRSNARAEILFTDATNRALWAFQSGTQNTAILTGEGLWLWRFYEYKNFQKHELVDECIRQTIQFLCNNKNDKPFRAELSKQIWNNPEHITISAFLRNANNENINQPEAKVSIKNEAGSSTNYIFERFANNYRLNIGALPEGNYSFTAQTVLNGKTYTDQGAFAVQNRNIEDQESGCNFALMYALAEKNNGSTFTLKTMNSLADSLSSNTNIKPILNERIEANELINWKWIFILILLVATAEWLLRKYWMAM